MRSLEPGSAAGYGAADRLLHRLALSPAVLEITFDLERALFGRAARRQHLEAPVFVCGLARAGTTVIMRLLHRLGAFATLSYRDLPFPLAPNAWAWATHGASRKITPSERGHGDGIMHDLDSPEAIEEVFWRCFEGRRYIKARGLAPVPPDAHTIVQFRTYLALLALYQGKGRYLSKNNNNVLRVAALAEEFHDAALVHPFREPRQQAASLLNQHLRALQLGRVDRFRARFMTWLGHHEFGVDHRPFLLPDPPAGEKDGPGIDYWLAVWIRTYRHLLAQPGQVRARQCFIDYDALCAEPAQAIARLGAATKLAIDVGAAAGLRTAPSHEFPPCDAALASEAADIHAALKARAVE